MAIINSQLITFVSNHMGCFSLEAGTLWLKDINQLSLVEIDYIRMNYNDIVALIENRKMDF